MNTTNELPDHLPEIAPPVGPEKLAEAYVRAMVSGRIDICIQMEQSFDLFGYPPEVVVIGLNAADNGKDVHAAVDAYLTGVAA